MKSKGILKGDLASRDMSFLDLDAADLSQRLSSLTIYSDDIEVVSAAMAALISSTLSWNKGLLLHAAGLSVADKAMVFLARSGGGKSTVLRNRRSGTPLHDDKIAARKTQLGWIAGGVPLLTNHGETGSAQNAPIAGLFLIKKSQEVLLNRIQPTRALPLLAKQVYEPTGRQDIRRLVMENLLELVEEVPVYMMHYRKGYDVSKLLARL